VRIPRDLSGAELAKALRALGYERARQDGSHIRLTTQRGGEHHVTVPNHSPIKLGTLRAILKAVAAHHKLTIEELIRQLGL
jgi:predicted RNA binding protein YcfA (HicA-like mRNA interferase family)